MPWRRLPRRRILGIAVSLALLLVVFWWWQSPTGSDTRLLAQTTSAEMFAGDLPDGSTYLLNAGTTLRRTSDHWNQSRQLLLEGEGFFEVKPGVEFLVQTTHGTVRVLGTSFNVRAYPEAPLSVVCRSGIVAVSNASGNVLDTLRAGEALRLLDNESVQGFTPANEDWRDGTFRFDNGTLREIIAELERQFDTNIQINSDLLNERLTTTFRNDNLDTALRGVLRPFNLSYQKISPTEIVVKE